MKMFLALLLLGSTQAAFAQTDGTAFFCTDPAHPKVTAVVVPDSTSLAAFIYGYQASPEGNLILQGKRISDSSPAGEIRYALYDWTQSGAMMPYTSAVLMIASNGAVTKATFIGPAIVGGAVESTFTNCTIKN